MSVEVGSKLLGKVTGITHFGAFVELPDGETGLVHISEIAHQYVKDINDFLKIGDEVEVKVLNVEKDGKIGLSIRRAQELQESESFHRHQRSRSNLSFEEKMSRFLKDSEERLAVLRRNMDAKRGGRGARRG